MIRLSTVDNKLFFKKILVLFVGTVVLAPLIYYKLYIPSLIYIGGLLVLHIFFVGVYIYKTPWKKLWQTKSTFILRLVAVVFFLYLLSQVKFKGDPMIVLADIGIALLLHGLIISGVMVKISRSTRPENSSSLGANHD